VDDAVCRWSVVVPALADAAGLGDHVGAVLAYFDARQEAYEVMVVVDGAEEASLARARRAVGEHPAARVLARPGRRGKGAAVREGMLRSRGALRLMTDPDGATPIAEVARLESALAANADVAVGSRARPDAEPSALRPHRRLAGAAFNLVVRAVGVRGVSDSQSGFKLFRGGVAADLFAALTTPGYGFDVELLLLAQRRGYRVVEVPVAWVDRPGSRVGVMREGPRMLVEVLRARWRLGRAGRSRQ